MDKLIVSSNEPRGLEKSILDYIEETSDLLKLNDAILYYGFPVFNNYDGISFSPSFCIVSKYHGVVLFNVVKDDSLKDDEFLSDAYSHIESAFKKSKILREKKNLLFSLASYLYTNDDGDFDNDVISSFQDVITVFNELKEDEPLDDFLINEIRSILEGAKSLNRIARKEILTEDSDNKNNILLKIEKEIANFDVEQRRVALSMIEGPQRIRGLAGSGKTVILCMKVALIHLKEPNRKILYTFYTKSLYMLIRNTIDQFYRHFSGAEPNWKKIDILHAWGGRNVQGVYYNACAENNVDALNFTEAKNINYSDPFDAVCTKLSQSKINKKYDHILIDEAQDLPNSFFLICYYLSKRTTGKEKNIVWGYDDLQSIFNIYQRTPQELFGSDSNGNARINLKLYRTQNPSLDNDLVLYRCYRTPLEVLLTAHALGLGIYSIEYPVQILEDVDHWKDVGYTIPDGVELLPKTTVSIERKRENTPLPLYRYQEKDQIIKTKIFESLNDECSWICDQIEGYVNEGISPHEIMIISLDDRNSKAYFSKISLILSEKLIRANNVIASNSSNPKFFVENAITLSTVHRAKGNEAKVVLVCGIDAIFSERKSRSGRNKIFTAFTRTKAWLVVSGLGEHAQYFINEIKISLENSPYLNFVYPDKKIIETIQRDLEGDSDDIKKLNDVVRTLKEKGYTDEEIKRHL